MIRDRRARLLTTFGAALATAALVAGCGSSHSPTSGNGSSPLPGSALAPAGGVTAPAPTATGHGRPSAAAQSGALAPLSPGAAQARDRDLLAHDRSDRVTTHQGVVHATQPAIQDDDESSPTGAKVQNPCTLVTGAELTAILHEPIAKVVEAPQGPTCIYQPARHGATDLTIAVETAHLSSLRLSLRHAEKVRVADHTSYCGIVTTPMAYTQLPGGQVLVVSAPCQVAATMIHDALPRVRQIAGP